MPQKTRHTCAFADSVNNTCDILHVIQQSSPVRDLEHVEEPLDDSGALWITVKHHGAF